MSDAEPDDDGDELDDELDTATGKKTPRPPGPYDQRIGATVDRLMKAKGWEYPDFVREVRPAHQGERWNKNRIGRLIRGERRISITELLDVIATLGAPRREFFEDAGLIDKLKPETKDWLAVDTTILPDDRRAFLRQYELAQRAKLEADKAAAANS